MGFACSPQPTAWVPMGTDELLTAKVEGSGERNLSSLCNFPKGRILSSWQTFNHIIFLHLIWDTQNIDSVNIFLQTMISRMEANKISYSRGCISKGVKDASDSLTIQNSSSSVWKRHRSSLVVSHPAAYEKKKSLQGIPCGPGVRTPNSHCRGPGFDCWSKLKFHKLRGAAKKEKRKSLHVGVMSVRPKRVFLSSCHSTELTSSLITNSEICKCFKNRNRLK